MSRHSDKLERLRVAAPCRNNWDQMAGDERVRFCAGCRKSVYNFSAMTRGEIEALLARREGSICGRLSRRIDGTIIAADELPALFTVKRRVSRVVGAAFTAALTLCASAVPAQTPTRISEPARVAGDRASTEPDSQGESASIIGTVFDPTQAVIPNANVTLINERTGEVKNVTSGAEGEFQFTSLETGLYKLEVAAVGFHRYEKSGIRLGADRKLRVDATLQVGVLMGEIIEIPPPLETTEQELFDKIPSSASVTRPHGSILRMPLRLLTFNAIKNSRKA